MKTVGIRRLRIVTIVFIALLCSAFYVNWKVIAPPDDFVLEAERHWETYGVGGTCIPGTHNLAIADVDGDGVKEIFTGGLSYDVVNGVTTTRTAPLKIWTWDGQNLTLEHTETWSGNIWCVFAADADGDGKVEVITDGSVINSTGTFSVLMFWNWDGKSMVLRGSYDGVSAASISVGDFDSDGKPEIAAVGRPLNVSQAASQLSLWRWDGKNLAGLKNVEWSSGTDSRANSVFAHDLNNDGIMEIVTGGYDNGVKNSRGQLRVWQWNGTDLTLKSNEEWHMVEGYSVDVAGNPMGNTDVNSVKVGDVDGDGYPEILSGGFTFDGSKVEGQLRIWNWSGGVLNLEKSQEWVASDITEVKSISISDVDGDGKTEVVNSGVTAGYGSFATNSTNKEHAQLKVWGWDGHVLTLKQSKDWIVGEGVAAWQVGTGDLANNSKMEIVTVGCMYIGTLCDPDLRIWALATVSAPSEVAAFPYLILAIVGAVSAAIIAAIFLFIRKRRR